MIKNIKKLMGLEFKSYHSFILYFVLTAVLTALYIVFDKCLTVYMSESLKSVSFNFVPVVIAAMLMGPVSGALVYGLGDMIGSILFPMGAPIPMLSVLCALMGFVYGLFLYCPFVKKTENDKKNKILNMLLNIALAASAVIINQVVLSLGGNTLVLSFVINPENVWGQFFIMLPSRFIRSVITIAVQTVIIPLLLPLVKKLKKITR